MNLSIASLRIKNSLSPSPFFTNRRLSIKTSIFKNINSPISFNPQKLLLSRTTVCYSLSSAVATTVSIQGPIQHPLNLTYSDNVQIDVISSTFSKFSATVFSASASPNVFTIMKFSSCLFQQVTSNTIGGCIKTDFSRVIMDRCCIDSCSSAVAGHFAHASSSLSLDSTLVLRCPLESNAPSAIVCRGKASDVFRTHSVNISQCSTTGSCAAMLISNVLLDYMDTICCNNSGKCIAEFSEHCLLVYIFGTFVGNSGHDIGVIYIHECEDIFIEASFVENGTPTIYIPDWEEVIPSFNIFCDALPVNDLERSIYKGFNNTVLPSTIIGTKPNSACVMTPTYVRPKEMITVISICASITGVILFISIIFIVLDILKHVTVDDVYSTESVASVLIV
jgi:hypothetical protein